MLLVLIKEGAGVRFGSHSVSLVSVAVCGKHSAVGRKCRRSTIAFCGQNAETRLSQTTSERRILFGTKSIIVVSGGW